ncbi:hypothetical protein [Ralstonia phage RP13]|nr:hypothetical protein [Ralstonia phage RP13]
MNTREYYLQKVVEECNEIGQAISKIMIFGPESWHPETGVRNIDHLVDELNNLQAAVECLRKDGLELPGLHNLAAIMRHEEKIKKFLGVARSLGNVVD